MNQKYEKLKTLLKELFQLDQPDLDFGIYRIMHARSAELTQFLDHDLLPPVRAALAQYQSADKVALNEELEKLIAGVEAASMDPEQSPKVKALRQKLAGEAVDLAALESEVYDHLFSFFRRYYSEGDFLAKRVYKPGVYAIPYEGEEVTLHWDNKDQYYIKTSEYLRDYAFRLRPEDEKKPMRVHFRLADAAEGEHGNVKAAEGKDRVFILSAENFVQLESHSPLVGDDRGEGTELVIRFEYRPATLTDWPESAREGKTKPPVQKDLIALAVKRVLAVTDAALAPWIAELAKPHVTANGERADYSRLEAHLKRYTARKTPSTTSSTRIWAVPAPGAGLLHQERGHAPGRRGERVRAEGRTVPLQDQGHPQDRGQDHRLPRPARRLPEEAVAEEEVCSGDLLLHPVGRHPGGVLPGDCGK
jgi:adenine-specific DNA-methyltransferase